MCHQTRQKPRCTNSRFAFTLTYTMAEWPLKILSSLPIRHGVSQNGGTSKDAQGRGKTKFTYFRNVMIIMDRHVLIKIRIM